MIISLVPYKIFPVKTGGEKAIALLTKYLAQRMPLICVTVKSNTPSSTRDFRMLNLLSDSRLRYINFFYFFLLGKLIREYKATHLLLEHPYYGWLGVLLKWFKGVKLVIRSHNIESQRWKSIGKWWWPVLYQYEKWVHRQADYNLFITNEDKTYALENYSVNKEKCMIATYGIMSKTIPLKDQRQKSAAFLRSEHNIKEDEIILLFNGMFNYKPNRDALKLLLNDVVPLLATSGLKYKLIICGSNIPPEIVNSAPANTIVAGFVNDIDLYLKGTDVFLNPITDGGGIKTKLVEALGYNLSSVSFKSGATGVPLHLTGNKLYVAPDGDLQEFARCIQKAAVSVSENIPEAFFEHFNWEKIAVQIEKFINS